MKKFSYWLLGALLLLFLAATAFFGSGYLWSLRDAGTLESFPLELTPQKSRYAPGEEIFCKVQLQIPAYRKILEGKVSLPAETVSGGPVKYRILRHKWNSRLWQAEFPLETVRPGITKPGTLTIAVSPARGKTEPETIRFEIPSLNIEAGTVTAPELELAPESKVPRSFDRRWHWLWILLLIPVFFWWSLKRKKKAIERKLSLKERTLEALTQLRTSLLQKQISAEGGVVRLCDLIRNYMEQRYHLPLSRRTTAEFLEDMEREPVLPEEHRPFLREFLGASDLIKFAKAPCDASTVNRAIESAEKLVERTAETLPEVKNV